MNFKLVFTVLSVFTLSFNANASHWCTGKVTDIQLDKNSTVYASISGIVGSGSFCKLSDSNEFCKGLYSALLVAKSANSDVTLWFKNDTNKDCNKGSWTNLSSSEHGFYHFRLN